MILDFADYSMKTEFICILFGLILCATEGIKSTSLKYTINHNDHRKFTDCDQTREAGYSETGVYHFWLNESYPYKIHCVHDIKAKISYTIIQRRVFGNENFYRGWHDYVYGFGDPNGDYWAGLNKINYLTTTGNNVLRIYMSDWLGNHRSVSYKIFKVGDATTSYRLSISGFSGNVPDDLSHNNGTRFATYDHPDIYNCALYQHSGWWFNYCSYALPNGIYYVGGNYTPTTAFYDGIYWKDWMGYNYSLKFISMQVSKK